MTLRARLSGLAILSGLSGALLCGLFWSWGAALIIGPIIVGLFWMGYRIWIGRLIEETRHKILAKLKPQESTEPPTKSHFAKEEQLGVETLTAYALRHEGMTPRDAFENAMRVIYDVKYGTQLERQNALSKWGEALKWKAANLPQSVHWEKEAVQLGLEAIDGDNK